MSTILKALRRLEEAKTVQIPRPLREQVATSQAPRRGLGWLGVAAAVSTGVALGAVGFIVWPQLGSDLAAPRHEGVVGAASQSDVAKSPQITIDMAEPQPSLSAFGAPAQPTGTSTLPTAALASRVEVVERIPPLPPPDDAAPDSASDDAATLAWEAVAAAPPEAVPVSARAPEAVTARREAPAAGSGLSRPVPTAPSKLIRAFIPTVVVVRTVWHPAAERRLAEIEVDGRPEPLILHEGDAVGPLVVGAIEPSGVVFLHDEVELRRRVGIR